MTNQPVKISRMWQYSDGSKIEFNYSGSIKDNSTSTEKLDEILINIFSNRAVTPSLIDTTEILKNIFKDLQEQSLEIYVDKEKEYYEGAVYYQSQLSRYTYHEISMLEKTADIEMNHICTPKKGVQTNFKTLDNFKNQSNLVEYQIIFNKCMKTIQKLQNIKEIKLNDTDKLICTIYHLFYQENPDFSKPEHRTKTQTMLAFLTEFNICIPKTNHNFYAFNLRNSEIVSSIDLMMDLRRLAPLGEISEKISFIKLPDLEKQTIKTISQEIRNHMKEQENPTSWFANLVRVNYIKNYCLSSRSNIEDIVEYSNCSKDTVTNNLKLVRKLDNIVNHSQKS